MAEPAPKKDPNIQPEIRPNLHVVQGGGESTSRRANLEEVPEVDNDTDDSTAKDLSDQEQRFGVIQGGGESTPERGDLKSVSGNVDDAKQRENEGNPVNYTGNGDNGLKAKQPATVKGVTKGKGATAAILAFLGLGGGLIAILFPGMAAVHFKETLFNDLNDAATALELRKDKVLSGRIATDSTGGLCAGKLSVGCRFKRFGKPFIDHITKAGAEVTCVGGPCDKRFNNKIKSIKFPDGTVLDDPAKMKQIMMSNVVARSTMNRAYNPVFMSMWDKTAGKALLKMGVTKAKKPPTGDVEKDKEAIRKSGNTPAADGKPLIPKYGDPNDPTKVTGYTDSDGKNYSLEDGKKIQDGAEDLLDKAGNTASKVVRGVVGSVGVIGAASTACNAIKGIEMVSMGAKAIRTAASVLAVAPIHNTADAIKAGEEVPSVATAVGEMLTETNQDDEAIDEKGEKVPNPDKGKSAFDSVGFQTAAGFLTQPKLTTGDARFMVGTPTTGVIDTLSRMARNIVRPSACGVINNPWVQAGSVILGVAAAIFTGGASVTQIVAQAGFSAAVSVGMAYVEGMLKDMAAGNLEDSFKNVGVGNIGFVGTSEITQRIGGARGMGYQTDENMDSFNKIRAEVRQSQIEVARYDARNDPMNPMLEYSFAGILARQMLPLQLASTPSSKLMSFASLPLQSIQSIFSPTSAALDIKSYNRARYDVCQDEAYKELGIKADVFCNLRRAMTDRELGMDSLEVADWMIANNYVDDTVDTETAELPALAKDNYKKFLTYCVEKSDSPPGPSEEDGDTNWANKKNCVKPVDIDQNTLSRFRVFTLDYSVIEGMDNEAESIGTTSTPVAPGAGGLVTGEAKDLARQVANNSNIVFVKPTTKTALENFANTGQAINSCGQAFTIDPMLTGVMLTLAQKYKIFVGNFGFNTDRSFCDTGQHPKGRAIDINGIEQIGGGKTSWGQIRFGASEVPVITNYANDWLTALPRDRGGVGQKGCGGFAITPPPGSQKVNGSMFFNDSCDHLHIDVRQR